ncbi:MAG: aminopeptidase N [Acidimicrobiia bacterium]
MAIDRLTRTEAETRAGAVSGVRYVLHLELERGAKSFRGDVTIGFEHHGGDTFIEWLGGHIERMSVNGEIVEPDWDGERISLPASSLQPQNEIHIGYERPFDHTGEGFHRFVDPEDGAEYLYTQFEPYSAHRVFPCFDQPDLKATYAVSVTAPTEWAIVTAGREIDAEDLPGDRTRRVYAEEGLFSTYLLAICAGDYVGVFDEHHGIPLGLYTRASNAEHLDAEPLFDLTKRGMDFFSGLFSEPYPFGKYDQLFVPEFNWGGMENVAAVTYTDTVVFKEPPTEDQIVRRAEYFMHELAHMWFGDLVTLKWWNDLWLNESFASYVAYLALEEEYPHIWQDFNYRMKLWAYREDQRLTTHRIADDIDNTDETFLNFDGITYGKGAAVLKQLVRSIGRDGFRDGLRTYFRRHRLGNATLADFLAALQEGSGVDLVGWAARWLRTPSLNTLSVKWEETEGRVTAMKLEQSAPDDHPHLRPHALAIALLDDEGTMHTIDAAIDDELESPVDGVEGFRAPVFVYPNQGDHAFAKIALDPRSVAWARSNLASISEPLLRQQVWASLWEMVRDRQLSSLEYLEAVRTALPAERSLFVVQMVTATARGAVARYVPEHKIDTESSSLVNAASLAIDEAPPGDLRVLWGRALIGLAATPEDAIRAAGLVDDPPDGLAVDQDMRWSVAVRWVALDLEGSSERLAAERERDPSDRGDRAMAAAEAARPDAAAKEEVWTRLHQSGYSSLHLALAAAGGFWRRTQRAIVEPFVPRFFDGLPALFDDWEQEAAKNYYATFFPSYRIEDSTLDLVDGVLGVDEIGPMLRRQLIESADDVRRALACRSLAASGVVSR